MHLTKPEVKRALVAVYLLLPQIPMLFMGEEWNTSRPFQYFCDFEGELGDKVRKGRRDEFASFPDFADPAKRNEIPDPQAESTFLAAKLDWDAVDHADCRNWLDLYTALLALRQKRIVPLLARMQGNSASYQVVGPGAVRIGWATSDGQCLELVANLSECTLSTAPTLGGKELWVEGARQQDHSLGPWSVRWALHPGVPHGPGRVGQPD